MYVRIIRSRTQPGQVDEPARRWQEFMATRSRPPGVRAYFAGDRATNAVVSLGLSESPPDEAARAALAQSMQAFQERVGGIVAGPPTVEEYEVLAQL